MAKHILYTRDGTACRAPRREGEPVYVGPEDAARHGQRDVCRECVRVICEDLERQVEQ